MKQWLTQWHYHWGHGHPKRNVQFVARDRNKGSTCGTGHWAHSEPFSPRINLISVIIRACLKSYLAEPNNASWIMKNCKYGMSTTNLISLSNRQWPKCSNLLLLGFWCLPGCQLCLGSVWLCAYSIVMLHCFMEGNKTSRFITENSVQYLLNCARQFKSQCPTSAPKLLSIKLNCKWNKGPNHTKLWKL